MQKNDRTAAGCTVEDEPYKLLERDAEKSILAGPLRFPPGQLPFLTSLKAPVPVTHDAVTAPVMFGRPNITGELPSVRSYGNGTGAFYQGETGYGYSHMSSTGRDSVAFSASRSSSLYEEASTVQPASTRMLFCIKS